MKQDNEILPGWFLERDMKGGSALGLKLQQRLHSEKTPYHGDIDIYETETFGKLMVIDGCTMLSTREIFLYHEMLVHPALNSHAAPHDVVIVGGGDCGTLTEVLKHPEVRCATQIEIDERVTRLAEQYFPELTRAQEDQRAALIFGDGIQWMKDAAAESLDVIIVDSTDPVGPAEGLFGREFYKTCLRALRPDGLLVQQSDSPFLHLDLIVEMSKLMREAGFSATRLAHFPEPIYPSGWWSVLHARKGGEAWIERLEVAAINRLDTHYYSIDMHHAAFVMPPFVHRQLTESQ